MKVLCSILCCDYKIYSLQKCIDHAKDAGFDVLVNYEGLIDPNIEGITYLQNWSAWGSGFNERKFDQDQAARLTPICIARNMVMDFFQQTDYDYLLFVDSDVLIPKDTYQKLFTHNHNNRTVISGLVHGRGIHQGARYMFGEIMRDGNKVLVEYATCGFMAIPRDLVFRSRFRWGLPSNGGVICSEDPLYGDDLRTIFNGQWIVYTDCIAQHEGDLKEGETSQF